MDDQTAMLCKGRTLVVNAERENKGGGPGPLRWQRKEKPVEVTEALLERSSRKPGGKLLRRKLGDCGGSWATLLKR